MPECLYPMPQQPAQTLAHGVDEGLARHEHFAQGGEGGGTGFAVGVNQAVDAGVELACAVQHMACGHRIGGGDDEHPGPGHVGLDEGHGVGPVARHRRLARLAQGIHLVPAQIQGDPGGPVLIQHGGEGTADLAVAHHDHMALELLGGGILGQAVEGSIPGVQPPGEGRAGQDPLAGRFE